MARRNKDAFGKTASVSKDSGKTVSMKIQKMSSVVQEDSSLTQTAAVFKVNISTIVAWKRRYETTDAEK